MPLTDVVFDSGLAAHAEEFVAGGEVETDEGRAAARKSAALLADLVGRLAALDVDPPLPNPEWVRWESLPERHATATTPAWLEDTSRRVRTKLAECRLPPVLGHVDWEAQNIRWLRDDPLAVHDWDSLAWLPEAALIGTAAGVFASYGEPTLAPVESSEAFLAAYASARGEKISAYEREVAWAASTLVALHNARDELVFNRPRLTYTRLEAQHEERLSRANA